MVDRIVLIGAALSPDYDLTDALSHCRRGIVSFYSRRDWLMLGVGTKMFGTIDRRRTVSAGRIGFLGTDGEPARFEGLTQVAWTDAWRDLGHGGGHFGWLARRWVRDVLAPHLDGSALPCDGLEMQARPWLAS
jgi:hypothetical protein